MRSGEPPEDELGPPGDPESTARIICLRLLDHRARTRAELSDALRKRGIPADAATAVLDRFTQVGLIDDAALAENVASVQHRERGLARRAVAAKLRQRGVDEPAIQAALISIDRASEQAAAERLVQRKLHSVRHLEPAAQARRLVGMLGRRGYPPGLAQEVVRSSLAEAGAPVPEPVDPD